jgi:TPR repeat protein
VACDHAEAVRWWARSAKRGCSNAQYNLAIAYVNGVGVAARDETEAAAAAAADALSAEPIGHVMLARHDELEERLRSMEEGHRLAMARQAEQLKEEGNNAFRAGSHAEAALLYGEALALDTGNYLAYANRSNCWGKLGNWKDAVSDARR